MLIHRDQQQDINKISTTRQSKTIKDNQKKIKERLKKDQCTC